MSMQYELQVLDGDQQGASSPLPEGRPVSVGGGFDSDVVLRGLDDRRIVLTATPGGLQLQVLQGTVDVDGRSLGAGSQHTLALGAPLQLAGTRLGVVRVAAAPGEAGAAPAAAPPAAPPAAGAAQAAHAASAAQRSASWPRRLATAGGALAAVSIGVLAFAYSAVPGAPTPEQQARRAEAVLHGAGLQRLSVRADGSEVRVDGYLETTAQRARAEQLLAAERIAPRWQVWVNELVANAVQDVFRVHGVAAQVEAVGPGAVRARTQVADPLLLDNLRSSARRDVAGLAALEIVNDPTPVHTGPVPVIDDPGKRVASIVPGDPPYVVTVDGTRYFEGALLPTGHRIAGIEERQVVLEIHGVRTPLVF